ncbi:hypothetical protein RJT34_16882 [Clitoria ternatea]|uniref:Uncharacterized protein n=1 Tax=Clitoria ternatea TaxID=43366 RepID=A0AAN9J949_CLITE
MEANESLKEAKLALDCMRKVYCQGSDTFKEEVDRRIMGLSESDDKVITVDPPSPLPDRQAEATPSLEVEITPSEAVATTTPTT